MAQTFIPAGDPKAVARWSTGLAVDNAKKGYFDNRFMGRGEESPTPIQVKTDLEADAGDAINYDLSVALTMEPVDGDDWLEGSEEPLKFYSDKVYIDQSRCGVNGGGRMTRKRTVHDLRTVARARMSDWWKRFFDEIYFMYGSGARGINNFLYRSTFTGRAGNTLTAPDADHLLVAGKKVKATLEATHIMDLSLLNRAKAHADVLGGESDGDGTVELQPIMIDGAEHFVVVMHPWQEHDLRDAVGEGKWLDLQKAAAGADGQKNPIFKGTMGMFNNIILHSHKSAIRFDDYGADSDVGAARAMFMGRQHMVSAFGTPGTGNRFQWHEETADRGNQIVITSSSICGVKTCIFNSKWQGGMALDTAAADPNA